MKFVEHVTPHSPRPFAPLFGSERDTIVNPAQQPTYYNLSVGRSEFVVSLWISARQKRISCGIYLEGRNAKQAFKLLQVDKAAIEAKTGPLEWMELPTRQDWIMKFREPIDIENREQWPMAFAWLSEQARLFLDTFSERIRRLVIVDDAEEGTEGP
jgi:Domain of unknown function (DUF4268)